MARLQLTINSKLVDVDVIPETPLLWVLRDTLGLTGTKYGCGLGLCGACTVHLDGDAVRSCQTPVSSVGAKKITTIEGLAQGRMHPVQAAWVAEQVPQCGYCQSGQIMQAAALLRKNPHPTDDEISSSMAGNICRCATYQRIRRAIRRAAGTRGSISFSHGFTFSDLMEAPSRTDGEMPAKPARVYIKGLHSFGRRFRTDHPRVYKGSKLA